MTDALIKGACVMVTCQEWLGNLAGALQTLTIERLLDSILNTIPVLIHGANAIAYIIGIYLVVNSIIKMKNLVYDVQEHGGEYWKLIFQLMLGAMFIYIPTTSQVVVHTGIDTDLYYGMDTVKDTRWDDAKHAVYMYFILVGFIALIRGLLMFTRAPDNNGERTPIARGFFLCVAGSLCININIVSDRFCALLSVVTSGDYTAAWGAAMAMAMCLLTVALIVEAVSAILGCNYSADVAAKKASDMEDARHRNTEH